MLKFLFYVLLFWFLIRVGLRMAGLWILRSDNRKFRNSNVGRTRRLEDVEEASFTEIDESKP